MPTSQLSARYVQDVGFLLSNLRSEDSGVEGCVIWFSAGEFARNETDWGPKLLVVLGDKLTASSVLDAVWVTLENPPVVLGNLPERVAKQVHGFIESNRETLLQHWTGETTSARTFSQIAPLGAANRRASRIQDGLAAIAQWEAENGAFTDAELEEARHHLGIARSGR
jgi:hypothetical protein